MKTDTTHRDLNNKKDQQEIKMVIPVSIQCKGFKKLSEGRKANKTIAMAYHHDDVASRKQARRIFISHAAITSDDKQTNLHFFVSNKADKAEVEKKVRAGFEKLCAEEKIHLAKPEKERGQIKCWFCHKYDEYAKWVKTKWKDVRDKFEEKEAPKKTTA
ncbi:MAG: hypothetical protein AAB323_01570 [Pseudomonadota bacterium]